MGIGLSHLCVGKEVLLQSIFTSSSSPSYFLSDLPSPSSLRRVISFNNTKGKRPFFTPQIVPSQESSLRGCPSCNSSDPENKPTILFPLLLQIPRKVITYVLFHSCISRSGFPLVPHRFQLRDCLYGDIGVSLDSLRHLPLA